MPARKYLYVFISLFFLLCFPLKANAYTMFSYNPYFSTSNGGLAIYSDILNATDISVTQYSSCGAGSVDGCANVTDTNAGLRKMYIFMENANDGSPIVQIQDGTNLTSFYSTYPSTVITLPANEEGLFTYSYEFQDAPATCSDGIAVSKVFINQISSQSSLDGGTTINNTNLNTSTGIMYNSSFIVPASTSTRYLRIAFQICDNPSSSFSFKIDKFKFYTLDINEARTTWDGNLTVELINYCGTGSTMDKNNNVNVSQGLELLFGTDSEGYRCGAIKLKNITIGRRFNYWTDNGVLQELYYNIPQNLFVFGYGTGMLRPIILESFSLNQVKATVFTLGSYDTHCHTDDYYSIFFNGAVPTKMCYEDLYVNYSGAYRQTISLTSNSNLPVILNSTTPSGTKWQIRGGTTDYSGYIFNFFTASPITCSPHWECDTGTDYETYTDSNCNIIQNNYCGDCGCGATRCNYPATLGTYCDLNDPSHQGIITSTSTCQNIYNICPSGSVCSQLTPILTYPNDTILENYTPCGGYSNALGLPVHCINICAIGDTPLWTNCRPECQHCDSSQMPSSTYNPQTIFQNQNTIFNISSYSAVCIDLATGTEVKSYDSSGNQSTIKNILNNETNGAYSAGNTTQATPTYTTNAFGAFALLVASAFGKGAATDLNYAETGLALMFSTAAFFVVIYYAKESQHAIQGGALAFIAILGICTVLGDSVLLWGIFTVFLVLDAGIMTGAFKKIMGG